MVNTLPNNKILECSKLKALPENKVKLATKTLFVFDRVENIIGPEFSLFPQCFKRLRVLRSQNCVV